MHDRTRRTKDPKTSSGWGWHQLRYEVHSSSSTATVYRVCKAHSGYKTRDTKHVIVESRQKEPNGTRSRWERHVQGTETQIKGFLSVSSCLSCFYVSTAGELCACCGGARRGLSRGPQSIHSWFGVGKVTSSSGKRNRLSRSTAVVHVVIARNIEKCQCCG